MHGALRSIPRCLPNIRAPLLRSFEHNATVCVLFAPHFHICGGGIYHSSRGYDRSMFSGIAGLVGRRRARREMLWGCDSEL